MPERRHRWRCAGLTGPAALASTLCACIAAAQTVPSGQDYAQIERGRYLALVADCAACHTADKAKPLAGGLPIETPFGNVVAPNITPDPDTGIGRWSDTQFDAAIRNGVRPDGKRLYPAMPFNYYTRMSRSDVLALRAFLATLRPIHNEVVSDQLPFPFSVRASMAIWDALYFDPGVFHADPAQSAQWNRGAYLVGGPGHCGACHTPKTMLGGDKSREALEGYAIQGWFAPPITNGDADGLGRWSAADIVAYLKSGHNRFSAAGGPMGEEVMDSSSQWSDSDLAAVALYLKNLPGTSTAATPLAAGDATMTAGAALYSDLCSACHAPDGTGVPYLFPNLAASPNVSAHDPTTLIRVVLSGVESPATPAEPTGAAMPSYAWQLSDAEVAAVTTYIRNSWGHAAPAVSERDVHAARATLIPAP